MILEGKVALVTGSTSGIGLAIAKALAAEGAKLMINGFGNPADIERECAELGAIHDSADMSKPAEIEAMMKRCADELGGPDILVNNAGIQHVSPVDEFPPEKWDAIIAINLNSAFHTTRLAVPGMKARKWGRIVNIASTHGLVASGGKTAYVAAKHGIIGLTKAVALECADTGVTCNAVCPGWVLTPLVQKQIDARAQAEKIPVKAASDALLGEKQPSMQFVTTEQLAGLAVFFCSPAADQLRGVAWAVDGGWTAQ